jgi:ATP-dependent Zn protease
MPSSPTEIAVAFHEAGHAVMALALGRAVQRVSVQPNHLRQGNCELKKGTFRPSKDAVETEILILLGGLAAEARQTGHYAWEAAAADLRGVRSLLEQRASSQRQLERLERRMLDKAEYVLEQAGAWTAVERIAAELLRSTIISGRAARHLFEQAAAEAERDQ